MSRGFTRALALVMVVCTTVAVAAPALAEPSSTRPNPKPLWKAFPLEPKRPVTPAKRDTAQVRVLHAKPVSSGGDNSNLLLLMFAAALLAAGLAVIAVQASRSGRPISVVRARAFARQSFVTEKGGTRMANLRRKRRAAAADEPATTGIESRAVERLSNYSIKEEARPAAAAVEAPSERQDEEETEDVESGLQPDLAAVGEEVGSVLQSAHAAAERIRVTAQEDSERLRKEAQATAAAEISKAHRAAEEERADANRIRAEADRYAEETRAAAVALAEQRRADAERQAAAIIEDAQSRLASADAEVELKMRNAHSALRERVELLQAEAERYEDRLKSMLGVFEAMGGQLEELLGKRDRTAAEPARAKGDLKEALSPGASRSREG